VINHLHIHSYYSFLMGIPSPAQIAQAAVKYGMDAVALTDRHGLTGAVEFYEACKSIGVKPIIGLEVKLNYQLDCGDLILLAMDCSGWRSICRLSSLIQTDSVRDTERGITLHNLEQEHQGLICLTGGLNGLIQPKNRQVETARHIDLLEDLKAIFPDRIYIELSDPESAPDQVDLAKHIGIPHIATNPVYYLTPDHADLQRTLSAIRMNTKIESLPAGSAAPKGAYFLSMTEMHTRFHNFPEALANTHLVSERCNLTLPLGKTHYPAIKLPAGVTADSHLRILAENGAKARYGQITFTVKQRLNHELKVIEERGYAPLFLIVQEILEFAKQRGVPISSRGSAASSLVAYCLGITTPDPLALNLYFERFLNPARATPPDIDTDLCSERRNEVLRHVYDQYGADHVAMVATINRFRPRSALREVAKSYGLSSKEITDLVEGIPSRGWGPVMRRNNYETPFGDIRQLSPRMIPIFRDAESILGFPRHLSIHPGGIVISPDSMTDLVPTHLASKGMVITQFDLKSIEKMGLVKIDMLGTRGLTVLGEVADKIYHWNKRGYQNPLGVLEAIPDDDPDTAELVRSTRTIGCFQIESPGMRATLREIDAESPEDLMIALALYRPGPMTGGLKNSFVQRHLGNEPVEHLHPALASLLEDTYGVILYQEQVLLIASQIAGLSLADADLLRRAMSHFDPGERMKTLKMRFVQGAQEKSAVPLEIAEHIWDLMAAFAGYGFPKAHAASYAQVSWRSAWCKAHYPAEFMAAVLAGWGGYYSQRVYLNEARRMGLSLNPPHINYAQEQVCVAYPQGIPKLYIGLNQVRDLTRRTQTRIIKNRPFSSMEDFLMRVDPRPKEAENLVQIGALDGLGRIPDLINRVHQGGWAFGQPPLMMIDYKTNQPDWELSRRVNAQLAILGASPVAHPLELVSDQINQIGAVNSLEALTRIDEKIVLVGIRQTTQRFFKHNGDPFYILELEDLDGVIPVLMSPLFYRQHRVVISSTQPFAVEGKMIVSEATGEPVLEAQRMFPIL
jgi:DNA-directed DNA polymerase III PolC